MKPSRKEAREFLKSMKTREELIEYLNMLNITDEQRDVAYYALAKGWSRQHISLETGYSLRQIERMLTRVYDKMK
jgi:DNA-binding NarL/FixJ family response regulator